MGTFVTLAEVLESRGSSLEEDEVWALLLGSAEALIEISTKDPGNMCHVITPCSILLSTSGNIAFKTCSRFEDVASFTSPEISNSNACSRRQGTEKMVVYSLGMTLYWAVDYQLPQTQPVQLSDHLNSLLLSMCEDVPHKRVNLLTVLKTCEQRHKNSLLSRPEKVIKQMAQDILQTGKLSNYGACLTDRSQMVRERLRGASCQNSDWPLKGNSTPTQSNFGRSCHSSNQRSHNSTWVTQSPNLDIRRPLSRLNQLFGSTFSLNEKKIMDVGPEFIRMLEEPLVILELPNSIVSNKGRLIANQRELRVLMPNGRNILVKCDIKSRAGDIFDMIIAYLNIMEHFYFGLAYNDDGEFFFVNKETNISEVAPDSWKKVPTATFALYFRISYFVNNVSLLLHKLTRHQYYLQLRRDLLEDKLTCNEETCLFLGALALQAEWGDSIPEVHGKNFYQPEHYVSKSILQKISLPFLKEELLRLHANNLNMVAEESELEFLKTIQQLPDYGVLFHRVAREKKPVFGDLVLGVCAKGVIVYDVINNSRTASLRFHWREIISITSARRKFIIESSTSKKKHTFLTEKSKVAKYLCNLCSTQHKFHKEMGSRQLNHTLASEESIVQYAAMCRAKNNMIRRMSEVHDGRLNASSDDSMSKLCEDIAIRIEAKIKQQRDFLYQTGINSPGLQRGHFSSQKRCSEVPSIGSPLQDTPTSSRPPEREIVCASLNKDPRIGLGIVIVGEDSAERLDLGIFIASIVPGGPADRDGRIKPGGRMISLNQISLEGVSFSEAIDIMQNSSNEVELIVSQPKVGLEKKSHLAERNYESQSTIPADSRAGDDYLDELISVMMTPKSMNRLHVPEVRIINAQDDYSRSVSLTSLRPEEFSLKLRKSDGSLGISIAGGVNTGLHHGGIYIKSLVSGGVAEQDGRIQTGDRLLEVDGTRLQGFTDQQAAECLARTREVVSLVLERDGSIERPVRPMSPKLEHTLTVNIPASATLQMRKSCPAITMTTPFTVKPRDYSFVSDDNILEVTLRKRLNGLGFSFFITELDTSLDCGTIVRIKTLFPGQPAEKSGQIQQGDAILSINGESLKGLSSQQVLQLLRNSPLDVQLVLCRPAEGILPPITGNVGQLTCS